MLAVGFFYTDIGINSGVRPIASVVVLLVTIYFINRKMEGWAFVMSGLNIILTNCLFSLMFPRVMVSSLTIYSTTASPQALQVMSIVALIFIPVAVAYESWSYYIFRFIKIREGGKHLKETFHLITNTIHRPIKAVQYCHDLICKVPKTMFGRNTNEKRIPCRADWQ